MLHPWKTLRLLPVFVALGVMPSCDEDAEGASDESESDDATADADDAETPAMFGSSSDVEFAESLWTQITEDGDYAQWPLADGTDARQPGGSPHGAFVSIFVEDGGDLLVKENYAEDGETLAAITVMAKRPGYDAENADWFYAKYFPDGSLDTTTGDEMGVPLAGAVEPQPGAGCRGCHRAAADGDFVFTND